MRAEERCPCWTVYQQATARTQGPGNLFYDQNKQNICLLQAGLISSSIINHRNKVMCDIHVSYDQ